MIARSTGAAPRQRGSSDGWTLSQVRSASSAAGIRSPYAHTTTVGAPSSSPAAGRSGCRTGIPSRSATTFAGGAASLRPRPAGASGRVRSAATSCVRGEPLEDVGAERRGRGDRDPCHA